MAEQRSRLLDGPQPLRLSSTWRTASLAADAGLSNVGAGSGLFDYAEVRFSAGL
jgi:hypothetical protein